MSSQGQNYLKFSVPFPLIVSPPPPDIIQQGRVHFPAIQKPVLRWNLFAYLRYNVNGHYDFILLWKFLHKAWFGIGNFYNMGKQKQALKMLCLEQKLKFLERNVTQDNIEVVI